MDDRLRDHLECADREEEGKNEKEEELDDKLRDHLDSLSDQELSRIVHTDYAHYRQTAVGYADAELKRRETVKFRGLAPDTVVVNESADWKMTRMKGLNVIIDPMVFRTADVFLRGEKGLGESPEVKQP